MNAPYYQDDAVTLYHGDCREIIPQIAAADLICTDPPYGETAQTWDSWPNGWPSLAASVASSMWCFGSMRMFLEWRDDFADWRLAQDIVWEKQGSSSLAADRFKRVHEHALHWYRGPWGDIYQDPQREPGGQPAGTVMNRKATPAYVQGALNATSRVADGTRLVRSVIRVDSLIKKALHPTQKPVGILRPLIAYGCPPGGTVLDPFAGSGSTLVAAREAGRRAIGIEGNEAYCELIARRLDQGVLDLGSIA